MFGNLALIIEAEDIERGSGHVGMGEMAVGQHMDITAGKQAAKLYLKLTSSRLQGDMVAEL